MAHPIQIICLYEEPLQAHSGKSIFLAGCYHAGGFDIPSDLLPIVPLLKDINQALTLYLPHERELISEHTPLKPNGKKTWAAADWLKWEIEMLSRAQVSAFWMPRGVIDGQRPTGFLSSQEIRQAYLQKKPIVMGWPAEAEEHMSDFKAIAELLGLNPLNSMEAVFKVALHLSNQLT